MSTKGETMAEIIKTKIPYKGGIEERISKFALITFVFWAFLKVLSFFEGFPVSWLHFLSLICSLLFGYVGCLIIQGFAEYYAILKKKEGYKVLLTPSEPDYKVVETCSNCQKEIGTLSYNTHECQFCDEKLEIP